MRSYFSLAARPTFKQDLAAKAKAIGLLRTISIGLVIVTSNHARVPSSFQWTPSKIFFSDYAASELTGIYPESVIVVGWNFKRDRLEMDRRALQFPFQRFR